mgnify:CR=1 FL=1
MPERVWQGLLFGVAAAVLGMLVGSVPAVLRFEEDLGLGALFQLRGPRPAPAEVVVVSLDKASSDAFGLPNEPARWPRTLHAELVERLATEGAMVVAFDVLFDDPDETAGDARLGAALQSAGNVVLTAYLRKSAVGSTRDGSVAVTAEQLEEERRLFYVALTRARDEVLLTAAAYRRRYDGSFGTAVSRFVGEIPEHLVEREETAGTWSDRSGSRSGGGSQHGGERRSSKPTSAAGRSFAQVEGADWDSGDPGDKEPMVIPSVGGGRSANARRAVGKRVVHEKFGAGTVLEAEGDGPDMKLTVRFTGAIKKVLARFVSGAADAD